MSRLWSHADTAHLAAVYRAKLNPTDAPSLSLYDAEIRRGVLPETAYRRASALSDVASGGLHGPT